MPQLSLPRHQNALYSSAKSDMDFGSGVIKQLRSSRPGEDHSKSLKFPRTDNQFPAPKPIPWLLGTPLLSSNYVISNGSSHHQEEMLSFLSSKGEAPFLGKEAENCGWSCHQQLPYNNTRNIAGHDSAELNTGTHWVQGPFNQSQRMELQHQILIYKYIGANVPLPPHLLMPLMRTLNPDGFSISSLGSFPPGWGSFHPGYVKKTNAEPRRCHRTDGKRWRCSKAAVPNLRYCEKHSNRGRKYRSRNPVEGHATASRTTTIAVAPVSSSSTSDSVVTSTSGGASNSLRSAGQFKNLLFSNHCCADKDVNRTQDTASSLSGLCSAPSQTPNPCFSLAKQGTPVVNPSHWSFYGDKPQEDGSFLSFLDDQETELQSLLHSFVDDWQPKNYCSHLLEQLTSGRSTPASFSFT